MEKSYSPTTKKLRKARQDGDIAKSSELTGTITVGYGLLILCLALFYSQQFLLNPHNLFNYTKEIEFNFLMSFFLVFAVCVLAFTLLIVSVVVEMLQVGFSFNLALLKPKSSRLNPFSGFKKIAGIPEEDVSWSILQSPLYEGIKWFCYSVGTLSLLICYIGKLIREAYNGEPSTMELVRVFCITTAPVTCACFILSLVSLWVARRLQYIRLRMDREELKRELRDSEGREEQKQRRHESYIELGRQVENASVRRATFVVKRD